MNPRFLRISHVLWIELGFDLNVSLVLRLSVCVVNMYCVLNITKIARLSVGTLVSVGRAHYTLNFEQYFANPPKQKLLKKREKPQ